MRVMYVLNAAVGGATESALDLIRALSSRGHTCFAVLPDRVRDAEAVRRVERASAGLARVALPWWHRNYRQRLWKRPLQAGRDLLESGLLAGTVRALRDRVRAWEIDLVHTNTALTLEPALAARLAGRPHVWHVREQIGAGKLIRFWPPDAMTARIFGALSTTLVANSRSTAAFFEAHGVPVEVVPNGVDLEAFEARRGAELRAAWGIAEGEVLVGMVANLTAMMKRHEVFVRAARRLAGRARFVIVGVDPGEGGFSREREYARALKALAGDAVRFAGQVPDAPAVMAALDVLVHPCEVESFGRVAIEAMAAGRPVVAADGGGLAEIVVDGVTGRRVRPGDDAAFADAVAALIEEPALRAQWGEAGRTRAAAEFSLAAHTDRIEAIYRRLV